MKSPFYRLGGAAAAVSIFGCTTPQFLSGSDQNRLLATVGVGDEVRATTRDGVGPEFEIEVIDSGGVLRGATADGATVEVRVAEIAELEYRKPAPGRSVGLALGIFFAVAAVTAECEVDDANEFYDPCN